MAGRANANKEVLGLKPVIPMPEANAFTQTVKNTFQNEHEKYVEFVDVLKNCRAHRMDISSAVARLKDVFKDHEELIMGFATFLPSGYNKTTLDRAQGE